VGRTRRYRKGHWGYPETRKVPLGGLFWLEQGRALLRGDGVELEIEPPEPGTKDYECWPWRFLDFPEWLRERGLSVTISPGYGLSLLFEHRWWVPAGYGYWASTLDIPQAERWRRATLRQEPPWGWEFGPWEQGYPIEAYFAAHAYLSDPWVDLPQACALYGASEVLTSLCLWELSQEGYRKAEKPDPPPRPKPKRGLEDFPFI
jgi:hypothetical protein